MPDDNLAAPEESQPQEAPQGEGVQGRWTDGLQDGSLRVHPSLTKFQDVPSLAKSYVELESKIGSKGLLLPGEDASPAEIRSAMSQLGCPEAPVNLGSPTVPDGIPVDTGFMDTMRDAAWKNGLTTKQYQSLSQTLVDLQTNALNGAVEGQQQQMQEARAELESRWGASTQENLQLAQDAAASIYGEDRDRAMNVQGPNGAIGNNPEMLEVLAKLGRAMQEGGVITGARAEPVMNPQQAQDAINQAMLDKDFMAALHDERHVGHKEAYAKWSTLYNSANSGATGPNREQGGVFIR